MRGPDPTIPVSAPGPVATFGPPLIAAGADIFGGERRNVQQAAEAQRDRDFQERMSSTSYQRAVEDMKLAGINPMLAFQQGGASSPGGAQAQLEDVVGPAVSSAMHAKRLTQELRNMRAVEGRDIAQSHLSTAQNRKENAVANREEQMLKNLIETEKGIKLSNQQLQYSLPGLKNVANVEGSLGPYGSYINYLLKTMRGARK